MIKLKQYSQPTVSLEQELSQLESVVIALEAAQTNPEVARLLFGSSIGLESISATATPSIDVKELAKKLWQVLKSLIAKLTEWNSNKEKRLDHALLLTKTMGEHKVESTETIDSQHRKIESLVRNLKHPDEIRQVLEKHKDDFPDLAVGKISNLIISHLKFYGHHFTELDVSGAMEKLDVAVRDFTMNGTVDEYCNDLKDVFELINLPLQSEGLAGVKSALSELIPLVNKYDNTKNPFSFKNSIFSLRPEDLKRELSVHKVILNSWESIFNKFKENMEYAEVDVLKEDINVLSSARKLASLLLDLLDKHVNYVDAVYAYRKSFEV